MARCYYHPGVETDLTCTECGRPICPKEMVLTPVGYKCPEHARPARGQYMYVKPVQAAWAAVAALAVGMGGAALLLWIGYGGLLAGVIWGLLTAEATRRASGGHRGAVVAAIAVGGIAAGWAALLPFGGVSTIAAMIAALAAAFQLGAFGSH